MFRKKISICIEHELTQEEALDRIRGFLENKRAELQEKLSALKVEDISEEWNGNMGNFSFSALGCNVAGVIVVLESRVEINGNIPIVALPFRDKVETIIREHVEDILA
jgi:hypothetical protein